MRFELYVSLRYLLAKRREKFISIISLISILGVAVGVTALIVVIAVMSGFDSDLRDKIVGTNAHILIEKEGGVENVPLLMEKVMECEHVLACSPFVNGQAVLRRENTATGVILRGIDAQREKSVTKIGKYLIKGALDFSGDGIIIGSELSKKLDAAVGDEIYVITAATSRPQKLRVVGIFNSGMYEYDSTLGFVDIKKAQELYGVKEKVSGVAVKIDDAQLAKEVKENIQEKIGYDFWAFSWMDSNRNLFAALKLEKTAMFVILTLIVLVACFNIASTLIMVVMEKTKDIGILRAIGATNRSVMAIFALEGTITGILGTALGALGGFGLCQLLGKYKFITLPADIYYIDKLPVLMEWKDSILIIAAAIVLSFISSVYPAYQASRLDPVEALRWE